MGKGNRILLVCNPAPYNISVYIQPRKLGKEQKHRILAITMFTLSCFYRRLPVICFCRFGTIIYSKGNFLICLIDLFSVLEGFYTPFPVQLIVGNGASVGRICERSEERRV